MAQKTNPIIFRLGVTQVWKSLLQIYGKAFKQYTLMLHKYLQLQKLLVRLFYKNNFLLDKQEYKIKKNYVILNIYYLLLPDSKEVMSKSFSDKILKLLEQWLLLKAYTRFYFKTETKHSVNLLICYTQYLFEQNKTSKKVLWNLCKLLETQLNFQKLSYFKSGVLKVKLKGFKIRLSGRLEGSKNQMAKSIEQTTGSLPLTSIKNYIEYKTEAIYTKSGVCGIQIWLFYEII